MNSHEISLQNISKTYTTPSGKVHSVQNISLSIPKGTVFGFLGPNGAGKTTTMKMLVGLAHPTEGTIHVHGGLPTSIKTKEHIGFMPESPSFYLYLTGNEFMHFALELFNIKGDAQEKIDELLSKVDLLHAKNRYIRTYSKGMIQRLGLAQALVNDPEVLFLDEPLDGLDPLGRSEIKKIILSLKKEKKTIFFNSHILSDVQEICDTVGIIDKGILLTTGTPQEIIGTHKDLETAFVSLITSSRA